VHLSARPSFQRRASASSTGQRSCPTADPRTAAFASVLPFSFFEPAPYVFFFSSAGRWVDPKPASKRSARFVAGALRPHRLSRSFLFSLFDHGPLSLLVSKNKRNSCEPAVLFPLIYHRITRVVPNPKYPPASGTFPLPRS